jgi:hypothetical protein
MKRAVILVVLSLFSLGGCFAQTIDTTRIIRLNDSIPVKHNKKKVYAGPRIASVLSMVVPGLGQAYNRKYWKIPIVYAGLGGFGYMFSYYNGIYSDISKNLRYEYDDNSETANNSGYTGEQLQDLKIVPRKRRDLAIIGLSVMYVLNIVDANVDAHLKTFDVSDDLSIQVNPWHSLNPALTKPGWITGISVTLNFK